MSCTISAFSCVKDHIRCTPFVVAFLRFFAAGKQGQMLQETTPAIFRELLASMIATLSLRHEPERETTPDVPTKCQRLTEIGHYRATHGPKHRTAKVRRAPIDGENIAELLSVCLSLNLTTEADGLLESLMSEAGHVHIRDYQSMLLPFLKQTKQVLKDHNIPFTHNSFRLLYQSILSSYFARYLGKEPARGGSWTRPKVSCRCRDCTELNRFLSSPTEIVGRFPLAKSRRQHLHQMLDGNGSDCTHVTERRGTPQTLVVTKTHDAASRAQTEWEQRAEEARKWIEVLGRHDLEQLLGEDYEYITTFRAVRNLPSAGPPVAVRQPASSAQRNSPPITNASALKSASGNWRTSTVDASRRISQQAIQTKSNVNRGVKRKAEPDVIDLTGDDY
jgi:hypothetical protein